ncbi:MAG: DUF72 domain-containing protein [Acidimicrobiales bacterium]
MAVWIGTSGWQYKDWRERFYPIGTAQSRWLEHYADRFRVVEVNNAFYRLPEATTFEAWAARTPGDFVVAVKAGRYLTHVKRLQAPAEPVQRFMARAAHLGPKLGPVLLQLPPSLAIDLRALENTLDRFPPEVRVTVELRHESWFIDDTRRLLAERGVALCLADSPRRRTPAWRTAGWGYLRLHEGRARPHPCYGRQALSTWAERLAQMWPPSADVYVFFNNDHLACAVRDARVFALACRRAGLSPTRVPTAGEVRAG